MEIYIQGKGIPDVKDRIVEPASRVDAVLEEAIKLGFPVEVVSEALVFIDDCEEPVILTITLEAAGIRDGSRVHVHTCRYIEVSGNYNGKTIIERFSPIVRVRTVKEKLAKKFEIDMHDLGSFALLICGSQVELDENSPIGSLVHHAHCDLCFDLVKRENIQG